MYDDEVKDVADGDEFDPELKDKHFDDDDEFAPIMDDDDFESGLDYFSNTEEL